ncbi:unnamed protein product [Blepharisma stoltei]|uniref:Gustatory receptor n=1 Tax=Blepharisma stoltei TaxID=1481888 RepID=A0AAU9JCE0_9CILI|nr:unnamed protein product [Blepharisma stoltei]
MITSYAILAISGIYTTRWVRRLYRRQLRGLRIIPRCIILCLLTIFSAHVMMIVDIVFDLIASSGSRTFLYDYEHDFLLPVLKKAIPELAYYVVILSFYTIAVTMINTFVYQSVENYIENYKSHTEKITYMCINILVQGLLLTIGYISLLISLVKLTSWDTLVWDDSGLLFIISSILAGAMKYPLRSIQKWTDYFLNSYSVFFSIRVLIWIFKELIW